MKSLYTCLSSALRVVASNGCWSWRTVLQVCVDTRSSVFGRCVLSPACPKGSSGSSWKLGSGSVG